MKPDSIYISKRDLLIRPSLFYKSRDTDMEYIRADKVKEIQENFDEAIDMICVLCKRINPQHKECTACTEIDYFKELNK